MEDKQNFREYVPMIRRMRPATWGEVIGQPVIVRSAQNMLIKGQVPQAILMEGERGLGKTTCARLLAARLNCTEAMPGDPDPCGECSSCRGILNGREGMLVTEVDCGVTNKVEDIRDLISQAEYGSGDKFRIYVMDEFHLVSTAGKTALLKSLEEPNKNVKWVLCTTEGHKIASTIRSRCVSFKFRLLSDSAMQGFAEATLGALIESNEVEFEDYDKDAITRLVEVADGSIRQAISHLEQICAYGGKTLTATIVSEVAGKASRGDMGNLVKAVVAGNLIQADKLMRELYNDDFISDLLGYLYREYLPRQGTIKSDNRRRTSMLIRAIVSFNPVYQHAVNRDGLLYAMYDASHGASGLGTDSSDAPEKATSDEQAAVGDPVQLRSQLMSKFVKLAKRGGPVTIAKEWNDKSCVLELGESKVSVAIIRKAKTIPDTIKYVIPFKNIKDILGSKAFEPKQLLADGVMLKRSEMV